jgi:hypothetical protein
MMGIRWRKPFGFLAGWILAGLLLSAAAPPKRILVNTDRWYPQPFPQVWDTVLQVLTAEGWKAVRVNRGKGLVRSDTLEFPLGRFGPSVATDPPRLTWDYGIYHRVLLDQGRCSLKISVRPSGEGTRVAVAAIIEEYTFHRDLLEYLWAPRESNGAIEVYFLEAIDKIFQDSRPGGSEAPGDSGSGTP